MSIERDTDLTIYAPNGRAPSARFSPRGPDTSLRVAHGRAESDGWRAVSLSRLHRPYARLVKYPLERVLGTMLFVCSVPIMLTIALLIRVNLGEGVIYSQWRVGRDGRVFRIHKFRTMEADRRGQSLDFVGEDRRRTHKTVRDPRHTRLGTILRRTSLDELPQLWNVVRGEMTLIGPRPELESVVEQHGLWAHPRHLVRPGITGLWQTGPHRHELLHENLDDDLDYLETISPWTDLRIVARTILAPLARTGS